MAKVGFTLNSLVSSLKGMKDTDPRLVVENVVVVTPDGEEVEIHYIDARIDGKVKLILVKK